MRTRLLAFVLVGAGALLGNAPPSLVHAPRPADPQPSDDDLARAMRALQLLGAEVDGSTERCAECHSVNLFTLNRWARQSEMATWTCLWEPDPDDPDGGGTRLPLPPLEQINCLRVNPTDPNSKFEPRKLGIFTAGAHLDRFSGLFRAAYAADEWERRYEGFKSDVLMPSHSDNLLGQEEYDAVLAWTLKGMPLMERILGRPGNAPTSCQTEIKPELVAHLQKMQLEGWEAKNQESGMAMFGCAPGKDKASCFTLKDAAGQDLFPEVPVSDYPGAKVRRLREIPFDTSFWMRSSADGRFFANGARGDDGGRGGEGYYDENWGGMISDLQPQLTAGAPLRDIKVAAAFDPGFFPDDSGFIFQGTPVGSGFCRRGILEDLATTQIKFDEPACSSGDVDLYQAIGASLDGSDYVAITGTFEGDGGSGRQGGDTNPTWMEKSYLSIVPIVNDGQAYKSLPPTDVYTPWLGDWGLSPSTKLIASRVAGLERDEPKQMGYKFHFLDRKKTAAGYEISMQEGGTVCARGGKGSFSFDERFYVIYHYVEAADYAELGFKSADDPAFKPYLEKGSANVYVLDLLTGASRRVTRLPPGEFALFPHYRSDGWIYYLHYDANGDKRYAAATDASLRMVEASR